MINETLEADRAYQRDKADAYERGYKQGKADAESRWIPCEERLPEEDKDVLCKTLAGVMFVASYGKLHQWTDEKGWIITPSLERAGISFVDWWMPLPEFKKGVEE